MTELNANAHFKLPKLEHFIIDGIWHIKLRARMYLRLKIFGTMKILSA
ncbi:MAG: hypothetical protein ACD_67C00238G0002 [uncultured bacterium]|nr:MAG: hypothetical protein ACD_67C00238G0002 [uncultured bacterium]